MTKLTFELNYDQIDEIVLDELKRSYDHLREDRRDLQLVYDTQEELDSMIVAFEKIIEYFMTKEQYASYMASFPPGR